MLIRTTGTRNQQWNVTLEQVLNSSTSLCVSYIGINSYRLSVTEDLNQIPSSTTPYVASPFVDPRAPYQNWFALLSSQNAGFANYQAMELEVNHRMADGLFFQANYTWAKNLSDAQGDAPTAFAPEVLYGQAVTNRFDLAANRGNVEGTPRNRFLLTSSYQLPFGKGRKWGNAIDPPQSSGRRMGSEYDNADSVRPVVDTHYQCSIGSIEYRCCRSLDSRSP
ncbi:MAG TPA: hypothetical protein VHZ55_15070 [Bryobacteraceae bacterium]|nr:hypothetical protein [Bryobacteraceae bacterium]